MEPERRERRIRQMELNNFGRRKNQ
jgi:hypothetical protein